MTYREPPLNWPTTFTYFWMVLLWVLGIPIALKLSVMWGVLAILFPPASWVFVASWVVDTLSR